MRQDAEWVIEIKGLLGIMNILGQEHLLVIINRDEVCRLPQHPSQPADDMHVIYEL